MELDTTVLIQWLSGLINPLILIVSMAFVDLLGGAITAAAAKKFNLEKLSEFGVTLGKFIYAWVAAEAMQFLPEFLGLQVNGYAELITENVGVGMLGFVVLKYGASILGHVASIRQLPDVAFGALSAVGVKRTTEKYEEPETIIEVEAPMPHTPSVG